MFSSKDLHPQLRLLHLFRATFRWSGLGILVFHRVLVGGEHQSAHPYLTDRGGHHSLFVSLECHLVTLDSLDTSINTSIHLQYMFKMSHPLFNIYYSNLSYPTFSIHFSKNRPDFERGLLGVAGAVVAGSPLVPRLHHSRNHRHR